MRKIIHKWKAFKTAANLPKSRYPNKLIPRSDCARLKETEKRRASCLDIMHSTMLVKTKHNISTRTPYTNCNAWWCRANDMGFFCIHSPWAPCSHWVDHELYCIPKYFRGKCESVCPTVKACPKLSDATGQWTQVERIKQNSWKRKDLNLTEILWQELKKAEHKCRPTNLDELIHLYKEEWVKTPPQLCKR